MNETKPHPVCSCCSGASDICGDCPHRFAHRCADTLEVCIQGNAQAHRRVNVQCEPLDLTRAKNRLAQALADAQDDLEDDTAEAQSRYDEACDAAEDQYETDAGEELNADQGD